MKNVYDRVGSTLDDTKGARPSRNTSPIGREHEPFIRAAGSSPGVPIGFERSYKYNSSPKEYNLQRELRRNYEVLFV